MNSSRNEGYAEGKADGLSIGRLEGEASEKIKIAKIMLQEGSNIKIKDKNT